MKTNKEFYQQLLDYEKDGLIQFIPKHVPEGHTRIYVGKKTLTLDISIAEFARDIAGKVASHDFFTENLLERYLEKSATYVNKLVDKGEYVKLVRGKGIKFYVKKDWE